MSDIVDKVAKLFRLANNESASPAEAANAAAAAQELMLKHKLDEADVNAREGKVDSPVDWFKDAPIYQAGRLLVWRGRLADGVAVACMCRSLVCHGFDAKGRPVAKVTLVGKREDAEVVRYLYVYLSRQIDRLAKAYVRGLDLSTWPKAEKSRVARIYANNFRLGAVQQVLLRLMEKKRNVAQTSAKPGAMVLMRTYEEEVERMTDSHSTGTVKSVPTYYAPEARAAGMKAGQHVPIADGLPEASEQKGALPA